MAQIVLIKGYTCLYLQVGIRLRSIYNLEKNNVLLSQLPIWSPPLYRMKTCNLSKLLRDILAYNLNPEYSDNHSGNLIDYYISTYYLLASETNLPKIFQPWFLQDIPEEYYPVLQVAGLICDIGNFIKLDEYNREENHLERDWFYFLNMAGYIWIDGSKITLERYLTENYSVTSEEWKLVSVIIALYYNLYEVSKKGLYSAHVSVCAINQLIDGLISHIKSTGISFDPVMTFRLFKAIVFANVWAQRPVNGVGFVPIDTDINLSQKRDVNMDKWKKILNEERFSWIREFEEHIQGFHSQVCVGPLKLYKCDQIDGNVTTIKPVNLMYMTSENIEHLLIDQESPFNHSAELDPDIYRFITKRNRSELRRYLIRELLTQIEICNYGNSFLTESRKEIYKWYFINGENKLSNEAINDLKRRLMEYPRVGWTTEYIEMRIRGLVSPDYSLEQFIQEYDQAYYNQRIKNLESRLQILINAVSSLGFKYGGTPFESCNDLFESMSRDDSFDIPLLSPKGLLILTNILMKFSCNQYKNNIIDSLLNYMTVGLTGLFGEKYGIYGFYTNNSDKINLMYPYNCVE
jgi:hypothetical protein